MNNLIISTLRTSLLGVIALGVLLFLPAWTLAYWQAWVFIVVFVASAEATGVYLALKDPELLERRKNLGFQGKEQSMTQKIIGSLAILSTLSLLVFCAFDHRFAWSSVPPAISVLGDVLVVLGLLLDLFVLRENSYAGTSVQTFEGQKVISTGLYAHIRHPMYAGNVIMVVGIPLALGSWWGLLVLALIIPVLIWRILDEEKLLEKDLPGYKEYEQKVRYRLVPYLW
jgi:protein-S-isoprenylcysteine O-methyltransferase Ste14